MTCSAAELHWTEIMQFVACRYGHKLTDEQVNAWDRRAKVNYLKKYLITAARQIGYVFKQLWEKVVVSGMHHTGQVLNFDDQREFQNR